MTTAQLETIAEVEARPVVAFGCLPEEWKKAPASPDTIWFPFYDIAGTLNVAVIQPDGSITKEVRL